METKIDMHAPEHSGESFSSKTPAPGELSVYILHAGTAADDYSFHVRPGVRIDALAERPDDLVLYSGRSDIERRTLVARVLEAVLAASGGSAIEHASRVRLRNVVEHLRLRINPDLVRLAKSWDDRDVPIEGYSGRDRMHDTLPDDVRDEISKRGGPFLPLPLRKRPATRSNGRRRSSLERLAPALIMSPLALVAGELSILFGGAPSLTGAWLALGSTVVAIGLAESVYRLPDTLPLAPAAPERWPSAVPDGDYGAVHVERHGHVYRLSFPPTRVLERRAGRLGGLRDESSGEWSFPVERFREVRAFVVDHLIPASVRWSDAILPTVTCVFVATCIVMQIGAVLSSMEQPGLTGLLVGLVYLGAGVAAALTARRVCVLTERLFAAPARARTCNGESSALSSSPRSSARPTSEMPTEQKLVPGLPSLPGCGS